MESFPSCSLDRGRSVSIFIDGLHLQVESNPSPSSEAALQPRHLHPHPLRRPPRDSGRPLRPMRRGSGGQGTVQACETHVFEGMEVITLSPALSELRRRRLNELLSNHNAYCEPPCHYACPAGIDIPAYIAAIAKGDDAEAVRIVKERLPLPRIIGRVCPRPCESACRRTQVDGQAVAICQLKRFAADEVHGTARRLPRSQRAAHGEDDSRGGQWSLGPQRRLLSGPRRPPGDHLRGPGTAGRHGPARHPALSAPA